MESSTYDKLCYEVYALLDARLERRDEDSKRFATKGTAKEILHREILLRFFRSLDLSRVYGSNPRDINIDEDTLISRVSERELHDFLAILLFSSCRIEAARTFAIQLLAKDTWPANLCVLPANRDSLAALFGDEVTPSMFIKEQACFCPVVIRKGKAVPVQKTGRQRFPFLEESKLGSGAFGTVYKVKIAKGHFYDPQFKSVNEEPVELARKDYIINSELGKMPKNEPDHEIMKKILSSDRSCENIVEAFGALAFGPTSYSLFMPLALFDLQDYMMEYYREPPKTIEKKADIILCLWGVAGGLDFLHSGLEIAGGEKLVCYHMDLKPRNILIFEKADAEGKHIWKISDFGMSRVKTRREGQTSDRDFNTLFARRREPLKSSATVNLRGEGEFLAPESIAGKPTMNEKSDVWSLGCVASVVFVYLEEGATGVSLYQDERLEHPKSDGFDRFFLRNKGFALSKTHPVVTKWHARLIKKVSERGGTWEEEKALKEMLEFLEDSVLQEQPKRCDVGKLGEELHKTHSVYKTVESSAIRHTSRYRGLADKIASHGRLHKVPNHNTHQNTGCHIEKWLLGSKDSFKGCEISSDGTVAVFWTDKKISLFTSQSLSSDGNDVAQPADEFIISETNCVLKSIVLTDKCLVASTSGGKFQCYIFDLRRGPFVDATLNYHRPYALEHPEITKLAVAPGGHTMACVLRDRDKSHNAGWLLLAPTMSIEASPWIDKIDDPAADVIQLSFPTDDDIYIALRPCSTTRRREHQIRVIHFNIPTRMMDTLVIESQGLDSSNHVSFFTTFAHFQREPDKCAIVTRQKRLRITNLANNNTSPVIEAEIKTYRVLLLMMDPDDNKFYALGRHSASHAILVLEIKMPDQNTREVELRERAQISGLFYNDEFSARLCGTREGKYLLVTALMSANQRAIYKIHIGNPVRP